MGFRFQRRIKIAPGLRLNLSKRGVGLSAGTRGARVSIGPRGARATVGIPGTGISYTTTGSKPKRERSRAQVARVTAEPGVSGETIRTPAEQKLDAAGRAPIGNKSPVIAALLSLVVCGAGQWYVGQRGRAVLYFLGWILLIPWPFAIVNAWRAARRYNLVLADARGHVSVPNGHAEATEGG